MKLSAHLIVFQVLIFYLKLKIFFNDEVIA